MDRLRHLTLVLALAAWGCDEKPQGAAPQRFVGVQKSAAGKQAARLCDKTWEPGQGPAFALPPLRPLEGGAAKPAKGWRWVNVWATWCTPCIEELGLLQRWREGFEKESLGVTFELLSIDESEAEGALKGWLKKNLPGQVHWLRAQADFDPWLESVQVERGAAIPIHLLVAPDDRLRCVRVGAIHDQDWGAARALVGGAAR